jgi:predicted nucleic acid-binding protein
MRASVVKRGAWCQACQKLENLEQIKNKYSKKITDELELKCKQNKGRSTLDFYILEDSSFSIYNLHNYPNPVSKNMKIGFELRSPEENLTIDLRFYSASGHLMGKEKHVLTHVGWRVDIPVQTDFSEWPSGVYFYRLFIVSRGGQIATKAKQLIKLN